MLPIDKQQYHDYREKNNAKSTKKSCSWSTNGNNVFFVRFKLFKKFEIKKYLMFIHEIKFNIFTSGFRVYLNITTK